MLSLIDCIAFSGLTPAQADAVSHFKHVPVIVAAEWAETVIDDPRGCAEIEAILEAELDAAARGALEHMMECALALSDFRAEHPRA